MRMANASITLYIGIGFILLSLLQNYEVTKLSNPYYFCIALSGFLFILFDSLGAALKRLNGIGKIETLILLLLRGACLFLAILSIIVLPHVDFDLTAKEIQSMSNNMVIAGLGVALVTLGYKDVRALLVKPKNENEQNSTG